MSGKKAFHSRAGRTARRRSSTSVYEAPSSVVDPVGKLEEISKPKMRFSIQLASFVFLSFCLTLAPSIYHGTDEIPLNLVDFPPNSFISRIQKLLKSSLRILYRFQKNLLVQSSLLAFFRFNFTKSLVKDVDVYITMAALFLLDYGYCLYMEYNFFLSFYVLLISSSFLFVGNSMRYEIGSARWLLTISLAFLSLGFSLLMRAEAIFSTFICLIFMLLSTRNKQKDITYMILFSMAILIFFIVSCLRIRDLNHFHYSMSDIKDEVNLASFQIWPTMLPICASLILALTKFVDWETRLLFFSLTAAALSSIIIPYSSASDSLSLSVFLGKYLMDTASILVLSNLKVQMCSYAVVLLVYILAWSSRINFMPLEIDN